MYHSHLVPFRSIGLIVWIAASAWPSASFAQEAEKKGDVMSYAQARDFLSKHTKLVELSNGAGARVAVAPEWQGRVMTSTCSGSEGVSFGFINRKFIEAGKNNLHFNAYGAEDRMWLCPEGGQFSLWFKPGEKQVLSNWFTPPALNEGAWNVVGQPTEKSVAMTASLKFQNASAASFSIDVNREVRILGPEDIRKIFGMWTESVFARANVKTVAYETKNEVINRGPDFSKETGLISIWILGMLNSGPETVVMVPYKAGPVSELGPIVKSDYFGPVLPDRLKVTPQAVLFRGDGRFRSKIGASQKRARNVLGAIDFENDVLTLVQFTMPDDPTKFDYLNNEWKLPQENPYVGDVVNAYNDGPNDTGDQMGAFYELESISPALTLKTGESFVHYHRTVHVQSDEKTLFTVAKEIMNVDLEQVKRAF